MSEKSFSQSYTQVINAIEYCLSENLVLPSLILIYSAIDSISWVSTESENQPVNKRFVTWVDNWMLKNYPLPCTAIELYAARCGILHTLSPDSELSNKKGVRRIAYAWGTAEQKELDDSIKLLDYKGLVAVHLNDIFYSFRNGFADFITSVQLDTIKQALFTLKVNKQFAYTEMSTINELIANSKKSKEEDL